MDSTDPRSAFTKIKFRSLLLWCLAGVFVLQGVQLVSEGESLSFKEFSENRRIFFAVTLQAYLWILVWIRFQFYKQGVSPAGLWGPPLRKLRLAPYLWIAAFLIPLSFGCFWLVYYPLSLIAPDFVRDQIEGLDPLMFPMNDSFTWALGFLVIVIAAPLVEELIFRGILLHRWTIKWGMRTALLANAGLFGFMHQEVVGKALFGLVLGIIYLETGSLWIPVLIHALNNAAALFMTSILQASGPGEIYTLEQFQSEWWIGALGLAVSLPWLIPFLKRNWPKADAVPPYFRA